MRVFVHIEVAGESSKAKKAEEQSKTSAPEPPLEKAIIDHFSETLLPGRFLYTQENPLCFCLNFVQLINSFI